MPTEEMRRSERLHMLGYEDPDLDDLKQKYAIAYGQPSNRELFDDNIQLVVDS